MEADQQNLGCKRMWTTFSWSGSQNVNMYFAQQWGQDACQAVGWATEYSAFERDAYKRCVCHENIGLDSRHC